MSLILTGQLFLVAGRRENATSFSETLGGEISKLNELIEAAIHGEPVAIRLYLLTTSSIKKNICAALDLNDSSLGFSSSASVKVKGTESVAGTGHFRPFRALGMRLGRYAASAWFGGLSTAGNPITSRPCLTL